MDIPVYLRKYEWDNFDKNDRVKLLEMISNIRDECISLGTISLCDSELVRKRFVGEIAKHATAIPYRSGELSLDKYIEKLTFYLMDEMMDVGFIEGGFKRIEKQDKELYDSIKTFFILNRK